MPDQKQNLPADLTITEAVEKLDEFRQKIIDERYEELVEEGEIETSINTEVMESIDVVIYFIETMYQLSEKEEKDDDEF